jgi:hypothetical protein
VRTRIYKLSPAGTAEGSPGLRSGPFSARRHITADHAYAPSMRPRGWMHRGYIPTLLSLAESRRHRLSASNDGGDIQRDCGTASFR